MVVVRSVMVVVRSVMVVVRSMVLVRMMMAEGSACTIVSHVFLHALRSSFCLQFDSLEDLPVCESISSLHMKMLLLHCVLHFIMMRLVLKVRHRWSTDTLNSLSN